MQSERPASHSLTPIAELDEPLFVEDDHVTGTITSFQHFITDSILSDENNNGGSTTDYSGSELDEEDESDSVISDEMDPKHVRKQSKPFAAQKSSVNVLRKKPGPKPSNRQRDINDDDGEDDPSTCGIALRFGLPSQIQISFHF